MKRLMILLVVLMVTSVSYGENGPSPLVTPGSVSGLGTMAVVDSPVPVANGGTGATTAAAGLAALGGASLNGSSTVDFVANNIRLYGSFIQNGQVSREHYIYVGSIAAGATASYTFSMLSNDSVTAITEVSGVEAGQICHYYRTIDTFYVTAASGLSLSAQSVDADVGVGTVAVAWTWSGTNKIRLTLTNNADSSINSVTCRISFMSYRSSQLAKD